MQLRYFFLTILLFLVSEDFGFAQQSTEWTVPEGTIAHLGEEPINDIAYSPDGGLLAAASGSGIWLYDPVTHQEVARLVEHTNSVYSISFSPDGKTLASAGSDGKILLWRIGWVAADVNRDDKVNILDLVLIAGKLGQIGETDADVNGDGIVDIRDLVLVAGAFGEV